MLEGCQQDGEIGWNCQLYVNALKLWPQLAEDLAWFRRLRQAYPNSHMRYECNLRALVSRSLLDVCSQTQFEDIQNVQVGPRSLARECLVRFSVVSVDISE